MIVREERTALAEVVRAYTEERIRVREFAQRMIPFTDARDPAVWEWACFFLDIDEGSHDHLIVGDRRTWNGFQRLLMFLESDAEMANPAYQTLQPGSCVMALAVGVGGGLIGWMGLGDFFISLAISLFALIFAIRLRTERAERRWRRENPDEVYWMKACYPFRDLTALRRGMRKTGFKPAPYPPALATRRAYLTLGERWQQFRARWRARRAR